jgi:hypothetical protein
MLEAGETEFNDFLAGGSPFVCFAFFAAADTASFKLTSPKIRV